MTWTVRYINGQLARLPDETQGVDPNYVLTAGGTWTAQTGGSGLSSQPAYTVTANNTGGTAVPTAVTSSNIITMLSQQGGRVPASHLDPGNGGYANTQGYMYWPEDVVATVTNTNAHTNVAYYDAAQTWSVLQTYNSGVHFTANAATTDVTPTSGQHLVNKDYVDSTFETGSDVLTAIFTWTPLLASGALIGVPGVAPNDQFTNLYANGNITLTGTVDGRDVATDGSNQDNLQTLTGMSAGSTNLGTFTGGYITANETIQGALQDLSDAIGDITNGLVNASDAQALSGVSETYYNYTPAQLALVVAQEAGAQATSYSDSAISSTTAINILSHNIPSGTMGTTSGDQSVRVRLRGSATHNSGDATTKQLWFIIKVDSTAYYEHYVDITDYGDRTPFAVDLDLCAIGTNKLCLTGQAQFGLESTHDFTTTNGSVNVSGDPVGEFAPLQAQRLGGVFGNTNISANPSSGSDLNISVETYWETGVTDADVKVHMTSVEYV